MILARTGVAFATAALALGSAPASADVLEIGYDGNARWIAGGQVAVAPVQPDAAGPAVLELLPDDFSVPDASVADPASFAGAVPPQYAAKVMELSRRFDLSPALIEALVWQESRWQANARSWAGARGLSQLMPGTAAYLGVNPDDPYANLEGGARYLREQLDRFDGDLEKALAAYNAGPERVAKAGGIPNIRETKLYVAAIMVRLSQHSRSK